jgi:glutamine amidotransferase
MKVLIVDYGMGNLGSVRRSFEECGADVLVSTDPGNLKSASKVVLPGVGAFFEGMENLVKGGWTGPLKELAQEGVTPILGICLGMQLLADRGFESGEIAGLGMVPGEVVRLVPKLAEEKIPHVGWNDVHIVNKNPLFENIPEGSDFYFVHSFHFKVFKNENIVTTTSYCGGFVSAVMNRQVYGVQFHPEKSSFLGFQLIKNFLRI